MSNYSGFVLNGNSIDAAATMMSLKDLWWVGQQVRAEFPVLKTYECEFDVTNAEGRMPTCFGKECGRLLAQYVMLRDPNGNEIEVQVERKIDKVCFKNGWYGLRDFYDIGIGAWVLLTFEAPNLMFMTLYNRLDEEIEYPNHSRPVVSKLDRKLCESGMKRVVCSAEWRLTASDVYSGCITRMWDGFCKDVLPNYETAITVVDYLGFYWRCSLKIGEKNNVRVCTLGGEWGAMCRARNFFIGQVIRIAVTADTHNVVVYLKPIAGQSKPQRIFGPLTRIIGQRSGEALYSLTSAYVGVEVAKVRHDMLKFNTYRVDYDLTADKARMPACFVKEYGVHVDDVVLLRDRNQNTFEVRVHKKKGKVYLREGWIELMKFYRITLGAWVRLTYAEPNLMLITIRNRYGVEIDYPTPIPPAIRPLLDFKANWNVLRFRCSAVHILDKADLQSEYLVMSWSPFCRELYLRNSTTVTIIDHKKFTWKCTIQFSEEDNRMVCRIGGDWRAMCVLRKFGVGHAIKLGVSGDVGNDVLHLIHVPLQCYHTNYVEPIYGRVNPKYVYQVNHYFTKCPIDGIIS